MSDQQTVLGALYDLATKHLARLLALIVGIYVLRRLLDYVAERTGLRVLGLVVMLIEAFFMLMVIMGGIRVFQEFQLWLRDRAVMQWLAEAKGAVADFFAIFKVKLPEILTRAWAFFSDHLWPVLIDVVAQPLFGLAVAALVFGSRVLSLAELWRRGQPYASRMPGATAFARYREKRAFRRLGPPPKGVRLAAAASRRPSSATSMTNTYRTLSGQADLLSHVVLADEHAVVGHVVGADRLVAGGQQHDDEQDRAVQQWHGYGLAARHLRARSGGRSQLGSTAPGSRPLAPWLIFRRCRLHRLSVSTAGPCVAA